MKRGSFTDRNRTAPSLRRWLIAVVLISTGLFVCFEETSASIITCGASAEFSATSDSSCLGSMDVEVQSHHEQQLAPFSSSCTQQNDEVATGLALVGDQRRRPSVDSTIEFERLIFAYRRHIPTPPPDRILDPPRDLVRGF